MTEKQAKKIRAVIEQGAATLDDATVSTAPEVLPQMKYDGSLISSKTRINWNGNIKRAANDLWDREENNPDNAPSLWEDVMYKDGYRIIPETITVQAAFSKDEIGWWKDRLYKSLVDNNVYTPEQYSSNWELYN